MYYPGPVLINCVDKNQHTLFVQRLQSVLNAVACVIFHPRSVDHITDTFATCALPYLGPLVPVHSLPGRRSLCSASSNHLLMPSVKRSTVGSRAFSVAGPNTWNALPEDVTSSQSEYTFRHQLKMWLFRKSFPDIIIWYWLHLDLSVPTLRWFCRLMTAIWCDVWYECANHYTTPPHVTLL